MATTQTRKPPLGAKRLHPEVRKNPKVHAGAPLFSSWALGSQQGSEYGWGLGSSMSCFPRVSFISGLLVTENAKTPEGGVGMFRRVLHQSIKHNPFQTCQARGQALTKLNLSRSCYAGHATCFFLVHLGYYMDYNYGCY